MTIKFARFRALGRSRALFRSRGRPTAARHDQNPHAGPRIPNAGLFGLLVGIRRRDWD